MENPVTERLLWEVEKELEAIRGQSPTDSYFPGDPFKTFDNLINLDARETVWTQWVEFLQGHWDYFLEDEDEE